MSYSYSDSSEESWTPEDDFKQDLLTFLNNIKAAGSFCTFGVVEEFVLPGLHIPGIGNISLPITENDARRMITQSKQAPFGKKNETIVDTAIRNTWELEPVEFRNPGWQDFLDKLLPRVAEELGIAAPIQAEFYKLLIYEKGAMFKPHRDTEKARGMFGTLVICLPSSHKGGEVELRHAGKTVKYETAEQSAFDMSYLAWYCDVTHEIHPVSAGHRIVLTYNLTAKSELISARGLDGPKLNFTKVLEPWNEFNSSMYVFKLEHSYSSSSLSRRFLKGSDAQRIKFLHQYCQENNQIMPLLALMQLHSLLEEDMGPEENVVLHDIKHLDGVRLGAKEGEKLPINICSVLQKNVWRHREPDKQYGGEYIGNQYAGVEKEYNDAVVILVKTSRIKNFLLGNRPTFKSQEDFVLMLHDLPPTVAKFMSAESQIKLEYSRFVRRGCQNSLAVAAVCALCLQRTDWFSEALAKQKGPFAAHSYSAIGTLIDVDNPIVDLDELSISFTRSASLQNAWDNSRAFISGSVGTRSSITLLSFARSIILQVLRTASMASAKDAIALKHVLLELEGEKKAWKSFTLEAVKSFITRNAGKETFMNALFLQNYSSVTDHPVTQDVVMKSLYAICEVLNLESFINFASYYDRQSVSAVRSFLSMVMLQDPSGQLAMKTMTRLLTQVKGLGPDARLELTVMSLEHDASLPESCQILATSYLIDVVGQEPHRPKNWMRSKQESNQVHCCDYSETCEKCQLVLQFVLDSKLEKQVFCKDIVVWGGQRSHQYLKIEEIKKQDESGWLIVKTNEHYLKMHKKWLDRLNEFKTRLSKLGEDALQKLGAERDHIVEGKCIRLQNEKVSESGSPPRKRLKTDEEDTEIQVEE